jgi:CheY-like chemotaxis protein
MAFNTWNILVVEDDPDGQDVVQRILTHHHITFDAVYNAEDSLSLLSQKHYTAAIVDLALPKLDGWGLLRKIRSDPATATLPCFAITAFHSPEVALQAIESGFTAYFPKPIDPGSLVSQMEQVIKEM